MQKKSQVFAIKPVAEKDRQRIQKIVSRHWGSEKIVTKGKIHYPHLLPGFLALKNGKYIGLISYRSSKRDWEIIVLQALTKQKGIGTALLKKVIQAAKRQKIKRIWLITTNDNLDALRFWQRRGFALKAVYPKAIMTSRKIKPKIPKIGNYKIPLRDEIELEMRLE